MAEKRRTRSCPTRAAPALPGKRARRDELANASKGSAFLCCNSVGRVALEHAARAHSTRTCTHTAHSAHTPRATPVRQALMVVHTPGAPPYGYELGGPLPRRLKMTRGIEGDPF